MSRAPRNDNDNHDHDRRQPAKLFHKKTRSGCQRCKARRVKCDEAKPVCANCTRLQLDCIYSPTSRPGQHAPSYAPSPRSYGSHESPPSVAQPGGGASLLESESRRKTELDLFYHYFSETAHTIAVDDVSKPFWGTLVCGLALKSDAVLYSLLVVSALHRATKSNFTDATAMEQSSMYLNLAVHEHSKDMSDLHVGNVDLACLTSSMLRVYSLARLQHRPLDEQYEPPMDWLRMTGTSNVVFREGWSLVRDSPNSITINMLKVIHHVWEEDKREHIHHLAHLLERRQPHEMEEPWDEHIEDTYATTLNYVAAIWKMRREPENRGEAERRILVFPMVVDRRFVSFIEEKRPRALVILGQYFAMFGGLRRFWWVGNVGRRELRAIAAAVPAAWRGMLGEAMEMVEEHMERRQW